MLFYHQFNELLFDLKYYVRILEKKVEGVSYSHVFLYYQSLLSFNINIIEVLMNRNEIHITAKKKRQREILKFEVNANIKHYCRRVQLSQN